jgi:hypothetical protein
MSIGGSKGPKKIEESEAERATQEVAMKGWQRQKRVGIPQQNRLINEFQKMDDRGNVNARQGRFVASVTGQMPQINAGQFNPNTGGFARAAMQMAQQRSGAGSQALTQGRESGENARREGLRSMAALATGTQNRGLRGASQQAAAEQAQQLGAINKRAANDSLKGAVVGNIAGWGVNKFMQNNPGGLFGR